MNQPGLFDYSSRLARIDNVGDPLAELNKVIDWEQFRELIELSREKARKSPAGAKGYDSILMFKILIIQALYNLSDERLEFQVLDRYSFSRFLGIQEGAKVPDATTIYRFREELAKANVIELLFAQFDQFLQNSGFKAQKGQIVDASIVRVPIQRNSRDENKDIKAGKK
jgi:IS5 family transposase